MKKPLFGRADLIGLVSYRLYKIGIKPTDERFRAGVGDVIAEIKELRPGSIAAQAVAKYATEDKWQRFVQDVKRALQERTRSMS